MGKIYENKERLVRNERFIKAFNFVAMMKKLNQTQLALAIGSKTAYISKYKNGTRPVTEDVIDALIRISATIDNGDGQIYRPYLHNQSEYMLLRNVPDDEIIEVQRRSENPDYDILQRQKSESISSTENTAKMIDSITYLISGIVKDNGKIKDEITEIRQAIQELSNELSIMRRALLSRYDIQKQTIPMAAENKI